MVWTDPGSLSTCQRRTNPRWRQHPTAVTATHPCSTSSTSCPGFAPHQKAASQNPPGTDTSTSLGTGHPDLNPTVTSSTDPRSRTDLAVYGPKGLVILALPADYVRASMRAWERITENQSLRKLWGGSHTGVGHVSRGEGCEPVLQHLVVHDDVCSLMWPRA
jgi:hypothetical protein